MLLDIRLQMPRSRLTVVGGVADAAGEEDELVGVGWGKDQILRVVADELLYRLTL